MRAVSLLRLSRDGRVVSEMTGALRLMVVTAHPDDETLGFGGVLTLVHSQPGHFGEEQRLLLEIARDGPRA